MKSVARQAGASALLGAFVCLVSPSPSSDSPVPPTRAATALPQEERCRVQVRFAEIKRGFFHGYIVTSDSHGATHFRAGPASPGPIGTRLWAFLQPGSPKARRWGPLTAEHGPYLPGTVDYDAGAPPTMRLLEDGSSCGIYNLRLASAEIALNSAMLTYNPMTTNCNAFVRYALAWIHVTPGPPPVAAPGWYTTLRGEDGVALVDSAGGVRD